MNTWHEPGPQLVPRFSQEASCKIAKFPIPPDSEMRSGEGAMARQWRPSMLDGREEDAWSLGFTAWEDVAAFSGDP